MWDRVLEFMGNNDYSSIKFCGIIIEYLLQSYAGL